MVILGKYLLGTLPYPHQRIAKNILTRQISLSSILHQKTEKSYYEDLEIDPQSTSREIKDAFYKLSKEYHPDKNIDNPEALKRFQSISEAYELLSNPQKRIKYDKGVLGRSSSVAEREASSHRFEGETFYGSRGANRIHRTKDASRNLDHWVKQHKTDSFNLHKEQKMYEQNMAARSVHLKGVKGRSVHDKKFQVQGNLKTNQETDGKIFTFGIVVLVLFILIRTIFL